MTPQVLLVEDDPDHAALTLRAFSRLGFGPESVTHARDGIEALEALDAGLRPDLILLDLRMPRMGGLELLERLKQSKERRGIPVVILTTSDADVDMAKAYAHHVNSYLVKPPRLQALRELIGQVVTYWLGANRVPAG